MKHSKHSSLLAVALMILVTSSLGMFATPASASTTTYTGNGSNRTILESANNVTTGSITTNNTARNIGLPGGTWVGYQLGTTFNNIARNADFVPNGQFTGSSPWTYSESGDTGYLEWGYEPSPPAGTTTGSDYITLTGKTVVATPIPAAQMNFTSKGSWKEKTVPSSTSYGTYTNQLSSNEWNEKGTYQRTSYYYPSTVYANMYCDYNFTVSGATFPLLLSTLSYKTWVDAYSVSQSATLRIRIIFSYFPTPSTSSDTTILDWTPSGMNSKPTSNSFYDLTSIITSNGNYRVRLWAYVSMTVSTGSSSTLSARFDDVGISIRHTKFSSPSQATWEQTFNFGQYAVTDGRLTFKYYTDLSTIVPATDSYLSAWVGSTRYDIAAFSSITTGSWRVATISIPYSTFNGSATLAIKIGVYIGSNLQILTGTNPRFYFDNVTFFIKYKPTPASIRLGIYDDANKQRWNDTETATYGSGTLAIAPYLPRSAPWSGASTTFHFVTNGTNGKAGYNSTVLTYSYTSTIYVNRWTQTDSTTFTVHDDTRTNWYGSYDTPNSIGGYQYYNVSIYIPTDWVESGLVSQIKFGGIVVTNYVTLVINSSTSVIKIPSEVFAPNPPRYLLEIWAYSPNYLGPSQTRALLFSQGNTTNTPGSRDWIDATSFISKNITRLACYIRDQDGYAPLNVNLNTAQVRLYNESGNFYLNRVWSVFPFSNGTFFVQLSPWSDGNVTYYGADLKSHATSWYFAVNWTNNYEAASGIARFTTNSTLSSMVPTTLTSPKQPYTASYQDGFTLAALYTNARNGTGIQGATVTWRWTDTYTNWSLPMTMTSRGNYTAYISGQTAYNHFAPPPTGTWIQIVATLGSYVAQNISVRVYVRDIITTGSASAFPVPYQTYAWNSTILTSFTFTDLDHALGVTGANLYINNTLPHHAIGSSGIGWYYNELGNGNYQIVFIANATQTGLRSWSFTAMANKSHYQSASIYLNGFNVRDRLTSHTEPSLSITTPWGDDAIFLITYRDTDASGAPILGATATSTWTAVTAKPYTVTPLVNGTYRFSLNVAGLSPGTYSFSFGFSKPHWATISTIDAYVVVRRINTDLSSATNTITVYWGDNQTAVLVYKDLDHNLNIGLVARWDPVSAYDQQTGSDYSSSLVYTIYINPLDDSWTIEVNGSLPVGDYTLWIHAFVLSVNGYYVDRWFYPTLSIEPIATSLTQQSATLTVVWGDNGTVVVSYNDIVHGKWISGASVSVLVDASISVTWSYNGNGVYAIFLNGTDRSQPYPFTIQLVKTHYGMSSVSGNLQINPISTSIQVPSLIEVAYGDPLTFNILLEDLNHTSGVTGALVACNWTSPNPLGGDYLNGSYAFSLDSTLRGQGLFTIQITATGEHYADAIQIYTFQIGIVQTSLSPYGTPSATPWGDQGTILLDYNRLNTTSYVTGATITTNWTLSYTYQLNALGHWQINFATTGLPEGSYGISITVGRWHYENHTLTSVLTIRSINAEIRDTRQPSQVIMGNMANITFQLWDTDHGLGVAGATLSVGGLSHTQYSWHEHAGGYYEIDVDTTGLSSTSLSFTVNATKTHYLSAGPQLFSFSLTPQGLSTMMVMMLSGGSASVVVLGALGYVFYRRSKIPFVIKKIDQSVKLIGRGEMPQPVPMRTRTQLINSIFETKLAIMTKEKIEEKGEKKKKSKEVELRSPETLAPRTPSKGAESPIGAEPEESDVELIARELEKLEGKEDESEMIKREIDELEKRSKRKKGEAD